MLVNRALHSRPFKAVLLVCVILTAAIPLRAQGSNPTSATNAFYGSITSRLVTDDTLKLSLDEAIALGFKNNLGLEEAENNEKTLKGEKYEALQEFLPTLILSGSTGVYQHNLAALGFGPGVIGEFSSLFPNGVVPNFNPITKDTLTQGGIQFS